jgi:hypothetical protein
VKTKSTQKAKKRKTVTLKIVAKSVWEQNKLGTNIVEQIQQ